ncbi:blue copper protein 1a-like [Alnus glutinosa]|uniref:blue copper protein 1a-like n=1 Tax=Alnus glutinosa TaxID=3517 RepID=UPI002D785D79|nr:blue copper protein 1a-like [Alnus glutinosa]
MGGFTFAHVSLILIVAASTLAVCSANKYAPHPKYSQGPNKIIVGGSEGWRFDFSYTNWARKNGPFYVNDTLVFKYDPPTDNATIPHDVYLLPNHRSFLTCNLTGAQMLANVTQGGGEGFEFVIQKRKPHYFACGQHEGSHCSDGQMKFFVMPMLRRWFK